MIQRPESLPMRGRRLFGGAQRSTGARPVIERVNLSDALTRVNGDMDQVIDRTNVLSLGEQQRVAFARLFLRHPRFVFLDEATSTLDEDNQEHRYKLILQSGIGFISVGHRQTLVRYYEPVLKLQGVRASGS